MEIRSKPHPNHFYNASDQLGRAKCAVPWFNVHPCEGEDVLYPGFAFAPHHPARKILIFG